MTDISLTSTEAQSILICIPTCMRPKMLMACLQSIAATELPDGFETRLLVLDNDVNESAKRIFGACSFPFPARYAMEPQRGLSSVRNRALCEAQNGDYSHMAFVDDDQTVDKKWLVALTDGMAETGADAIGGHVKEVFPDGNIPWWIAPSKISPDTPPTIMKKSFTDGLALIKASFFTRMRVDERFNLTGAGEYDFCLRAARRGFIFAHTGRSKARALVVPCRLTFRSHCLSQWQRQTGYVLSHRTVDGFWKSLLFLPKGGIKVVKGVLYCIMSIALGKKYLQRGTKNLISGTGFLYGVFSHGSYQKYAEIEGE